MKAADARINMIKSQLRPVRLVDDAVAEAMATVPRERFVPESLRGVAYTDAPLALGGGRFVMSPLVTALVLQSAVIRDTDAVLDVGCGTGYTAAVVSRIAGVVVALEEDAGLAADANDLLAALEAANVMVVEGALTEGYARQAPYDVILLDGAAATIPPALLDQLAEGGRLVGVLTGEDGIGRITVMTRVGGVFGRREIFDVSMSFLPGFSPAPRFVF